LATKAELYSRTLSEQRVAKTRYQATPEYQVKRAAKVAEVKEVKAKVSKVKALTSRLAELKAKGYTISTTDGKTIYSAPSKQYLKERIDRKGPDDKTYATYIPHTLTLESGQLMGETYKGIYKSGVSKNQTSRDPYTSRQITYNPKEDKRTEQFWRTDDEKVRSYKTDYYVKDKYVGRDWGAYREARAKTQAEKSAKLQGARAIREGKIDDIKYYDPKDVTLKKEWKTYNVDQKKAVLKQMHEKGIYSAAEKSKASALTHEAQIAEYGKVIVKTSSKPKEVKVFSGVEGAYTVIGKDLQRKLKREPITIKPITITKESLWTQLEKTKPYTPERKVILKKIEDKAKEPKIAPPVILKEVKPPKGKYAQFMFKLRKKLETKELGREVKTITVGGEEREVIIPTGNRLAGLGSALLYPIRTGESAKRLGITGLKSLGYGAALATLELATGVFPVTPIVLVASGIYGATKVPEIQERIVKSRLTSPVAYRETLSEMGVHAGVALAGASLGSYAVTGGIKTYKTYKENVFFKKVYRKGDYYWTKEGVSTKPLKPYEKVLVESKFISPRTKAEIYARAGGRPSTAKPTLVKDKYGLTRQEVQTQLYPERRIIKPPTKQQPFKAPVYKNYWNTKELGVRSYLGKYMKIPKQVEMPKVIDIKTGKIVSIKIGGYDQYTLTSPVTGKSYFTRTFTKFGDIKVPTTPSLYSRVFSKVSLGISTVGKQRIFISKKGTVSSRFKPSFVIGGGKVYRFEPLIKTPSTKVSRQTQPLLTDLAKTSRLGFTFIPISMLAKISTTKREQIQTTYLISATKQIEATKLLSLQRQATSVISATQQIEATKLLSLQRQAQIQLVDTPQILETQQITKPMVEQKTVIIQIPQKDFKYKWREEIEVPPPPPPVGTYINFGVGIREEKKIATSKEQGYDVMVKRKQLKKGKGSYTSRGYKKANKEPLSRKAALGMGAGIVDTYVNRSFRIKKTGKVARRRRELVNRWESLKHKFRTAKRNKNIMVEKSKHAIDSVQEKAGIPYESIRLRKLGLLQTKAKKRKALQMGILAKKVGHQIQIAQKNRFLFKTTKKKRGKKELKWL